MHVDTRAEEAIPDVSDLKAKSRVLRLPMAFAESCSRDAMQNHSRSVRPEAAYLPDNVPFVCEINALEGGAEEIKRIMFEPSYMVCCFLASALMLNRLHSRMQFWLEHLLTVWPYR